MEIEIGKLRFERHGLGIVSHDSRRETFREWVRRHRYTTGSAFVRVQRSINYGLSNAEWNALPVERRAALRFGHDG